MPPATTPSPSPSCKRFLLYKQQSASPTIRGEVVRMHRRGALLALPLTAALALSACGGSSSGGKTTAKPKTEAGLPAISINAHPTSDLKQGGTVIWSMDQFGPQWNVNQINGN